jgi:LacI family transcriptional regulator
VATINDIAEITGYSKSTISRALKNNTRISKKTRDQILKIAKELNYLPNSKAVSLSTGRNFTLGVIVPYPTFNSYYANIIHSIINATFKKILKSRFYHRGNL